LNPGADLLKTPQSLKHFVKFLVFFALVPVCEAEESQPLDTGSAYFPLKMGIYDIYAVQGGSLFAMPNQRLDVNGMTFEKILTVEQERNEDLMVCKDERHGVYALGVGLVYKEITELNYCTDENCRGQQKIDNGREMKLVIKKYGKH
jgi:hypothetical protein